MNFSGLIFLLFAQFFAGRGVVRLFGVSLKPAVLFSFSMICGVFVVSLVPCVLQLLHIPLTASNLYYAITVGSLLLSIPLLLNIKNTKFPSVVLPKLYEIPFLLVFLGLAITSVWRCFYFPPTPRDVLTGTELIAEFAAREQTMINSVFKIDLRLNSSANNIYKSPFITALQVVYKLLVHPFGQLWLSILFLSFTVWFYSLLRDILHPLLAGMLMLIYFAIPDLFAYTYVLLYDYANMVFFVGGYYFLTQYLNQNNIRMLLWSSFLFGASVYIRSETLVMVVMIAPLLALYLFKQRIKVTQIALHTILFVSFSLLFNFLLSFFIRKFIPVPFNLSELISHDIFNVSLFFEKFTKIATDTIFSDKGRDVYAHFFYFFVFILIVDIIWPRKYSKDARYALVGIGVVYLGLALLSFLVPSHTIFNSAKRGLFRLIPLIVLYMAHSGILQVISDYLKKKETAAVLPPASTVPVGANTPKQNAKAGKK
jgi:hypothetical protein